ncbi:tRNA uridine-5-carboxymethylaminomethyl(34) synthesis enzyme MnmG [Roseospirillum parvum]|uniref:tRNA uridine 5-carboxymethylaminomethyl modification enzyme MnmG n=1 Tax=Roseospirillum parvum TaxID=83401 RepID=A0A1G8DSM8_9PROT|nr:tRNA uridine-5-carboxymethylaminomethyl(34) synthesis enzyme MnmG [Roseospirillum parvum]SDH60683.1 tRNA uridine 5-carboxymethylaminomethyl modification enzyme [Roseospirillum parvum]
MAVLWDVIVIGGGHAGCEAGAAAARHGARTLLITHSWNDVGALSCNPAIGGLGKGHLVREVDALDGLMGRAIDQAGIQFRVLNRSKGPAVQGPRAQADRGLYRSAMRRLLAEQSNLTVMEEAVVGLRRSGEGAITGVCLSDGRELKAGAVVLTAGTFLRGVMHVGDKAEPGGRLGDPAADHLGRSLAALKLPMGRLKTGTPARLDGRTIDYRGLAAQSGDEPSEPFSYLPGTLGGQAQVACHITHTTPSTHALIRANLVRSALYGGAISGIGPRYCPSIEDKVVKFPDRERHQVFLEPEGLDDPTVYPNGVSTSLPADVQTAFLRTLPGLEKVEVLRPGYAIEYDMVDPRALRPSLEVRQVPGLFLAGQVIGTTGYEEAAGLGLVAGLNAARRVGDSPPWVPRRTESYLGVMIDDLVTRGVDEPYRMFTSRAEYRLHLRADNADRRLTALGVELGVVGSERARVTADKVAAVEALTRLLSNRNLTPSEARQAGFVVNDDGQRRDGLTLLGLPEARWEEVVRAWPDLAPTPRVLTEVVRTDARYRGYLARQESDIRAYERDEALALPDSLDYSQVGSLSTELRTKLSAARPATLGAAARLPGMTPAALTALLRYVKKGRAA